jgi:hypothetical protein
MDDIRKYELLDKLDWDQPISVQNEGVKAFVAEGDEALYGGLLPKNDECTYLDKSKLDNIVLILRKVGFPKNRLSIEGLLLLLQDLNWPGAHQGINVLLAMERNYLLPFLEQAIKLAYETDDSIWLYGLLHLIEQGDICDHEFVDLDTMKCFELLGREEKQ